MRLKTLGVVLVTALAAFTILYWITDTARRDTIATTQDEELLHFGEIIFSDDPTQPAAAACAQCHGADGTGGEPGAQVIGPNLHTRSLADKLKANPNYVHLAVSYGGVVVSGNVNSQMPAWSHEVGGPLNEQQIDAVVALVESWAAEAAQQPVEEVPNTADAGAQVYASAGCAGCHGAELEGGVGPALTNIGNEMGTDLPQAVSQQDQLVADYADDPRATLERWIRDSAANYNDNQPTGMPPHPEGALNDSALQALITFLLEQKGG